MNIGTIGVLWIAFLLIAPNQPTQPQEQADDRFQSEFSFLHAMAVNAASVQSCDVLLRHEVLHDVLGKRIVHQESLTRLIIDFSNQRFLAIRFGQNDSVSDGKQARRVLRFGGHFGDSVFRSTSFSSNVAVQQLDFVNALRELIDIVNIRYVGFRQFPVTYSPQYDFEALLAASHQLDTMCSVHRVGRDSFEVALKLPFLNGTETRLQSWTFDSKKLVADKYHSSISRIEDGKPRVYPVCWESYNWKEYSGVYVPTRINSVRLGAERLGEEGEFMQYEIDVIGELHWFSVNQPIPSEAFDWNCLNNASNAFQMVDPKLSGADSLSERSTITTLIQP
jgi:hypothetical protein